MRIAVSFILAAAVLAAVPQAQGPRPLPDSVPFLQATQENLARAQREQGRYAYTERRTELRTNPFGKIGTDGMRAYEVTPGPTPDVFFRRLIEKDGVPVSGGKPERQERRERREGRSGTADVVETLDFVMERREVREGREMIVVSFAPKPDARPQTREGKMAKLFTGSIWIDEAAREVAFVEATATESISFGFGVIARLGEGTVVSLTRQPAGTIWLPTALRFTGEGRAMLFRKLTVDFAVDWSNYREVRGR